MDYTSGLILAGIALVIGYAIWRSKTEKRGGSIRRDGRDGRRIK